MTLFYKYYTANLIDSNNNLDGSLLYRVLFWKSAKSVYLEMVKDSPNGRSLIDFRRVE